MKETYTYVVILENSTLFKIGKTVNLDSRIQQIKTANPFVKRVHYINGNYERYLHRCLAEARYIGEWFDIGSVDILDSVSSLIHLRLNSKDECEAVMKFLNYRSDKNYFDINIESLSLSERVEPYNS